MPFEGITNTLLAAVATRSGYADAEYNLATVESGAGNFQQAIVHFSRVLKRHPRRADAWNNLGNALLALCAPAEALNAFERALSLQPGDPEAQWNTSVAQLTLGHLPAGWQGVELRRRPPRHAALPRWSPASLPGQQVLIHAEQGLGDTIQFLRYCQQVSAASITLECHSELISLFAGSANLNACVPFGSDVSFADSQIPLMSLPLAFGTSLAGIPAPIPYLFAQPALIQNWRTHMAVPPRRPLGPAWFGPAIRNTKTTATVPFPSVRPASWAIPKRSPSTPYNKTISLVFRRESDSEGSTTTLRFPIQQLLFRTSI